MNSLNKKANYMCWIVSNDDNHYSLRSELFDGTVVNFDVPYWDVKPIEGDPTKRCWIEVEYLGKAQEKVAITLPSAIISMGLNISVKAEHIDRSAQIIKELKAK
jgi:hypothetical protein